MGDLLKKVMENPELLSGAMNMASMLASSGALNNLSALFPKKEGTEGPSEPFRPADSTRLDSGSRPGEGAPPQSPNPSPNPSHGMPRVGHKERIALLEAIRPFISPDKKDRLELLIRLLGVMELAGGMNGGHSPNSGRGMI